MMMMMIDNGWLTALSEAGWTANGRLGSVTLGRKTAFVVQRWLSCHRRYKRHVHSSIYVAWRRDVNQPRCTAFNGVTASWAMKPLNDNKFYLLYKSWAKKENKKKTYNEYASEHTTQAYSLQLKSKLAIV